MMAENRKTERRMNKTFKLDESIVKLLENESKIRDVSPNALVVE